MQTHDFSCESLLIMLSLITTLSGVGIDHWQQDCKKKCSAARQGIFYCEGEVLFLWLLVIKGFGSF
ncbi:hypothetical protein SUBVAR_06022 [Subdoligranulum variabile DSM 15176]|uniref:Uncharacterized protein n=1 Tax=Subdoligranulum variabile DSM 15176 TaxID=411471 RepID=D1PNV1_9FIRM|nr:hypothetical protein SUBVAR_06022 [Subdoligranulum variabile DSM 15176]